MELARRVDHAAAFFPVDPFGSAFERPDKVLAALDVV